MSNEELIDFEEIERKRDHELSFVKRLIFCTYAEVCFQRKLLPHSAFYARRVKGVKVFLFNAHNDDAFDVLEKLRTIITEIEHETIKKVRLIVRCPTDQGEMTLEVHEMELTYGKEITLRINVADETEVIVYNGDRVHEDFLHFITRLRIFTKHLLPVPVGSYGRMHVIYSDGKKMSDSGMEWFERASTGVFKWDGSLQDIGGIIGTFNGRQIGGRMRVGSAFIHSVSANPDDLREKFMRDNWTDDLNEEWDKEMYDESNGRRAKSMSIRSNVSKSIKLSVGSEKELRRRRREYNSVSNNDGGIDNILYEEPIVERSRRIPSHDDVYNLDESNDPLTNSPPQVSNDSNGKSFPNEKNECDTMGMTRRSSRDNEEEIEILNEEANEKSERMKKRRIRRMRYKEQNKKEDEQRYTMEDIINGRDLLNTTLSSLPESSERRSTPSDEIEYRTPGFKGSNVKDPSKTPGITNKYRITTSRS